PLAPEAGARGEREEAARVCPGNALAVSARCLDNPPDTTRCPREDRRRVLRDPGNTLRSEMANVRHSRPRPAAVLGGRGHAELDLDKMGDWAPPPLSSLYFPLDPDPRAGARHRWQVFWLPRPHRPVGDGRARDRQQPTEQPLETDRCPARWSVRPV